MIGSEELNYACGGSRLLLLAFTFICLLLFSLGFLVSEEVCGTGNSGDRCVMCLSYSAQVGLSRESCLWFIGSGAGVLRIPWTNF